MSKLILKYKFLTLTIIFLIIVGVIGSIFALQTKRNISEIKKKNDLELMEVITNYINTGDSKNLEPLICYGPASATTPDNTSRDIINYGNKGKVKFKNSGDIHNPKTYYFYPENTNPEEYVGIYRVSIGREEKRGEACIIVPYG